MKLFLCLFSILLIVFPLYDVPQKKLFEIVGISQIYLVKEENNKQIFQEIEKEDVKEGDLLKSDGVIIVFGDKPEEVEKKLGVQVVKIENVEEMQIVYGYTNLYSGFVYIDGKQSNVQIVKKGEQTIAGFPLILSGF